MNNDQSLSYNIVASFMRHVDCCSQDDKKYIYFTLN